MKTLVIDNFRGSMTNYQYGDINSGRSYVQVCSGQNPMVKPGQLTWNNTPIQIDAAASVITDLVMCGKERVESGILYVYAVGHTGRVYKIQVNDTATHNPDYDTPVLLATITSGSPTFTRGGFIDFYGATERIYIGHDKGVTRIDFNGSNETAISGTWTQTVPRPLKQFVGKLYVGNGANIAEIDSTATQTSAAKLVPGFPDNTQVRDLDVTSDGNYLEMVVSRLPLSDLTSTSPDTSTTASSDSYIFKWNGTDTGYTSFNTFPNFSIGANTTYQNNQYTFGTDLLGSAVYNPQDRIIIVPEAPPILPNAISSTGNILLYMTPLYFNGVLEADLMAWGAADFEVGSPLGYWDFMFLNATAPQTDILRVPFILSVSATGIGASSNSYTSNIFGTSKLYFSTLETASGSTAYRFYKWIFRSTPDAPSGTPITDAIYQTQIQMFSKKVSIGEVRIYGEPWVANNSFQIDLIGSGGIPITNGSYTFTAGTNLTVGNDYAWYNPNSAPTYAVGVAITNKGSVNHTINKIEIDYGPAGK